MIRSGKIEPSRKTANSAIQGRGAQDTNRPQRKCVREASNAHLPVPARSSSFFYLLSLGLHLAYQAMN